MRIDPRRFGKQKKGGHSPVMVNVRLRRAAKLGKPTARDVRAALQYILSTGRVPDGWQFAAIDWRHPEARADQAWRGPGADVDLEKLGAVIQSQIGKARVAIVRDIDSEASGPPWKSQVEEEL